MKNASASPHLRARHGLVDPTLTWGLPPGITAHTGIDALLRGLATNAFGWPAEWEAQYQQAKIDFPQITY